MKNKLYPGETGDFSDGMLNKDDEGGLIVKLGIEKNRIILDFGEPTAWIGLDKETAMILAIKLSELAFKLESKTKTTEIKE